MRLNNRGMSLLEITIATLILSVVLISAGSIYIAGIREFNRSVEEARVQVEASFALDHIFLNLMGAKDIITFNPSNIVVTVYDTVTSSDKKIKYALSNGNKINFYPPYSGSPGTPEVIASADSIDLTFARPLWRDSLNPPPPYGTGTYVNNYVTINITVTKGRMSKTFSTGVTLRGMNP